MMARRELYCSFCGKAQHEVLKLISGPKVFTCNECVELFLVILREDGIEPFASMPAATILPFTVPNRDIGKQET